MISILSKGKKFLVYNNIGLKIFDVKKMLIPVDEISKKDSVEKIIKTTTVVEDEIDSVQTSENKSITADTLKIKQALHTVKLDEHFISKIEYPFDKKIFLIKFLYALKNCQSKSTHVLYYGDSQIEEDRFSGYIRSKLQSYYGGSGCGLLPIMPIAQWMQPRISYSDNWYKWDCFADRPKTDEVYGIMGQTFLVDFDKGAGKWIAQCNQAKNYSNCLFNKVVLYYGLSKEACRVKFFNQQELVSEQIIEERDILNKKIFAVKSNDEIGFEMEGFESPYFYGVSFESFNNGIYVDNIALRGSSGTFFHLIDKQLLKQFFEELNVSLIILQFGGNAMPMIDSEEKSVQYANYIQYQLRTIKNINPEIPILFIGPSDMSVNIDGTMQTHPYLESVIEHLRKVVLKNNCAFFDMYKAMGGKNSMPVWVNENLAAKDYLHFSPAGARKMAAVIYYSLLKDIQDITKEKIG